MDKDKKDKIDIKILEEDYILIISHHPSPIKDIFLILKQNTHGDGEGNKQKELVIFEEDQKNQHTTYYTFTEEITLKKISSNEYVFSLSHIKKIISPTHIEVIVFFNDRTWWKGKKRITRES